VSDLATGNGVAHVSLIWHAVCPALNCIIVYQVLPELSLEDTALFFARAGAAAYDASIAGWKVGVSGTQNAHAASSCNNDESFRAAPDPLSVGRSLMQHVVVPGSRPKDGVLGTLGQAPGTASSQAGLIWHHNCMNPGLLKCAAPCQSFQDQAASKPAHATAKGNVWCHCQAERLWHF